MKKPKEKERIHIITVIAHQDKHVLHTYTYKSGGSLVIPSWQLALYSRHIQITHYRNDYNVSKAANQMSDQLNSLSDVHKSQSANNTFSH